MSDEGEAAAAIAELDRELALFDKILRKGGSPAVIAILRARREQIEQHGHSIEADDKQPIERLVDVAQRYVINSRELVRPGPTEDLDIAEKRLARAGGVILAAIERVRRERKIRQSTKKET